MSKKDSIIQDDFIDTEAADKFLYQEYSGIDLLPCVPDKLSITEAASVLDVSALTIQRMIQDKEIELTKSSILSYIMTRMAVNVPLLD